MRQKKTGRDHVKKFMLKMMRLLKRIKAKELAQALGMSTSYVSQMEVESKPLTDKALGRVLAFYGVERQAFDEAEKEVTKILKRRNGTMQEVALVINRMLYKCET